MFVTDVSFCEYTGPGLRDLVASGEYKMSTSQTLTVEDIKKLAGQEDLSEIRQLK